jgi:hypothetical protein
MSIQITGDKKIQKFLNNLPKAFRKEALEEAIKPAGAMIRDEAKSIVKGYIRNTDGQSKAAYLMRNTRSLKSKSKTNYGYNVYVKGKDMIVGDKPWSIAGYGVLFGEGAYHQKNRVTRKSKANRGSFAGFGNFINEAGVKKGALSRSIILKNISRISNAVLKNG